MEITTNILVVVSTCVSAISAITIAIFTYQSKKSQDKFQVQLSDLYRGIIIATLLSGNSDANQLPSFILKFKEYYDGITEIFKK